MNPMRWILAAAALAGLLGGCGGSDAGPPADDDAASLVVVSGGGQTATVLTTLPEPLVVEVRNAAGVPLAGRALTFVAAGNSGEVFLGATTTDASGRARDRWTLGSFAGVRRVEARLVNRQGETLSAAFEATALPGPVAWVGFIPGPHGDGRSPQGSTVTLPYSALDPYNNGVPGVVLSFSASDGGTVSPTQATTGPNGSVTVTWALGIPIGWQRLTITAPGGTPSGYIDWLVDRAPPGAPTTLEPTLGEAQTIVQHTRLPQALEVMVADAFHNGVPDVPVSFAPEAGSGGVQASVELSHNIGYFDPGVASWNSWFHSAGRQRIVATAAGLPPVVFTVDVTPSPHRFDGDYACSISTDATEITMSIASGVVSGNDRFDSDRIFSATTLDEATGALAATFRASADDRYAMTATLALAAGDIATLDGTYTITNLGNPAGSGTWHCARF